MFSTRSHAIFRDSPPMSCHKIPSPRSKRARDGTRVHLLSFADRSAAVSSSSSSSAVFSRAEKQAAHYAECCARRGCEGIIEASRVSSSVLIYSRRPIMTPSFSSCAPRERDISKSRARMRRERMLNQTAACRRKDATKSLVIRNFTRPFSPSPSLSLLCREDRVLN